MVLLPAAWAELPDDPGASVSAGAAPPQGFLPYARPTSAKRLRSYSSDMFGPYPFLAAAATAGFDQATRTPPEWNQGAAGYGKRFASDFGIAAVSTSTRYALAEVLKEDPLYYRCECKGIFPRLSHAVVSSVTARRGGDGHRVISIPALVAPYAGTMAATYSWYQTRYNAADGFRMGNYNLLVSVVGSMVREFSPRSFFTRKRPSSDPGLQR